MKHISNESAVYLLVVSAVLLLAYDARGDDRPSSYSRDARVSVGFGVGL